MITFLGILGLTSHLINKESPKVVEKILQEKIKKPSLQKLEHLLNQHVISLNPNNQFSVSVEYNTSNFASERPLLGIKHINGESNILTIREYNLPELTKNDLTALIELFKYHEQVVLNGYNESQFPHDLVMATNIRQVTSKVTYIHENSNETYLILLSRDNSKSSEKRMTPITLQYITKNTETNEKLTLTLTHPGALKLDLYIKKADGTLTFKKVPLDCKEPSCIKLMNLEEIATKI